MRERPFLCRICGCPVADTGVHVDKLDPEKLGNWWVLRECLPPIELDDVAEFLESQICQFCLWDARSRGEVEMDVEEFDWWTGHDTNRFYKEFYYKDEIIRPCWVKISASDIAKGCSALLTSPPVKLEAADSPSQQATSLQQAAPQQKLIQPKQRSEQTYRCHQCPKRSPCLQSHLRHLVEKHPDTGCDPATISCCGMRFASVEEFLLHKKPLVSSIPAEKCIYCRKFFRGPKSLRQHIVLKHRDISIQCNYTYCKKYFRTQVAIQKHLAEAHTKKDEALCPFCRSFVKHISTHIPLVHKVKPIRCLQRRCFTYFRFEADRKKHELECHSTVIHKCCFRKCPETFPSQEKLQKHSIEVHHQQVLKCPHCQLSFLKLKKHIRKVHKVIPIRCSIHRCATYFRSEDEKEQHHLEAHGDSHYANCIYCGETLASRTALRMHVKTLHPTRMLMCKKKHCTEYFKSEADRQKHFKEKHISLKIKYKCDKCNYTTYRECYLTLHTTNVHGPKRYRCLKCPSVLQSAKLLRRHNVLCHLRPQQRCEHCNKFLKDMKSHLTARPCKFCKVMIPCKYLSVAHAGQCSTRPLKCTICERYVTREDLPSHVKSEHASEMVTCEMADCAAFFETEGGLRVHMHRVHGTSRIVQRHSLTPDQKCPECQKLFMSAAGLRVHFARMHRGIDYCFYCNGLNYNDAFKHYITIPCMHCSATAPCLSLMVAHEKECEAKGAKLPSCVYCLFKFDSADELDRHVHSSHQAEKIQCSFGSCRNYFRSVEHLQSHLNLHHRETEIEIPEVEDFTSSTTKTSSQSDPLSNLAVQKLKDRMLDSVHQQRTRKCAQKKICQHCTAPVKNHEVHLNARRCGICNGIAPCVNLMREHLISSCGTKPLFPCKICFVKFGSVDTLRVHVAASHKKPCAKIPSRPDGSFPISVCEESTRTFGQSTRATHTSEGDHTYCIKDPNRKRVGNNRQRRKYSRQYCLPAKKIAPKVSQNTSLTCRLSVYSVEYPSAKPTALANEAQNVIFLIDTAKFEQHNMQNC